MASRGNKNNLRKLTTEEAREIGRKGGKASVKARRKKKAMKERLEILFDLPLEDKKAYDIEDAESMAAVQGKNISVQDLIILAQIKKAIKGDTTAAAFVRDTAGQNPATVIQADIDTDLNVKIDYGDDDE